MIIRQWDGGGGRILLSDDRHAAAVQHPVCLIFYFSLIPSCVDAQLTICVLSSNFSKIRLALYPPEHNY